MKSFDKNRFGISARTVAIATVSSLIIGAGPALAVDWSSVPAKDVTLFFPGQASWEWVLTQADHSGAPKFREGKNCRGCHEGEEADIGALIVSGEKLEPTPVPGKRGSIPVKIKAAYDDERLYFQFQFKAQDLPGVTPMDPDFAEKIAVMLDDGSIKEATRAGCWGACHDDATHMASNSGAEMKKYLAGSRAKITRKGGGQNYKPDEALTEIMESGGYLEYWQARLNACESADAVNGYILKERLEQTPAQASATAQCQDGNWTVELSRPLQANGGYYKSIEAGKTYATGFAIHDAHAANRFHHVSFEYTLVLDSGEADFVAVKK